MRFTGLALGFLLLLTAPALGQNRPIPQDAKLQQQRYRDRLAYHRQTLVAAYDKVGKKDPRWDKPAREALERSALFFCKFPDRPVPIEDLYAPAKRAMDAGCDDALVLYIYARASTGSNHPGSAELERRYTTAAAAMERSAYPPIRRVAAIGNASYQLLIRKNLSAKERQEAIRLADTAAGLLPKAAETYGQNTDGDQHWMGQCGAAVQRYRMLTGDYESAFKRVDAELAKAPALKPLRLLVKGKFLIHFAWEARGSGYANTVTEEAHRKFKARLTESKTALEEASKLKPSAGQAANLMITIEMGLGGERAAMEKWFELAMKADPNNLDACKAKMGWIDPKWHGSLEDMLAFGRACAATKNWQSSITLLAVDAHNRAVLHLANEADRRKYFRQPKVSKEIQEVCEDYLKHCPKSLEVRSLYAGFCYQCGRYAEADKQFKAMGNNLMGNGYFTLDQMKQIRTFVATHPADDTSEAPKPKKK